MRRTMGLKRKRRIGRSVGRQAVMTARSISIADHMAMGAYVPVIISDIILHTGVGKRRITSSVEEVYFDNVVHTEGTTYYDTKGRGSLAKLKFEDKAGTTYKPPSKNIAETSIFLLTLIFSLQSGGIGRVASMRSARISGTVFPMKNHFVLTHLDLTKKSQNP